MALPSSGQISIADIYKERNNNNSPSDNSNQKLKSWEIQIVNEGSMWGQNNVNGVAPYKLSEFYGLAFSSGK